MELHILAEPEWPALHRLMLARRFPHVPARYADARPHFCAARAYGLTAAGQGLKAAFVFGPPEEGVAFFDAVCTEAAEGRWATPAVLRALFNAAFALPPLGLGLRGVWVQAHNRRALKAALKAGFVPVTPLRGKGGAPVLVITPNLIPPSLQTNRKET